MNDSTSESRPRSRELSVSYVYCTPSPDGSQAAVANSLIQGGITMKNCSNVRVVLAGDGDLESLARIKGGINLKNCNNMTIIIGNIPNGVPRRRRSLGASEGAGM